MEERIISFHLYIPQLLPLSVSEEGVGYGKKDSRMILEELREKSFMSDSLFKIGMSHGRAMAEYIARTVTGCADIEIERVLTEYEVENIGHSVRLDALAIGPDGECYDFEVQNGMDDDIGRRMRVYEGSVSIAFLAKGERYSALPRLTSIWFMARDRHKRGRAVYASQWKDQDGNVTDNSVIRYEVNMEYVGKDEIGKMIYNMGCKEYDKMLDDPIKETMDWVKNTKEGQMKFSSDYARWRNEGREEGRVEGREEGREEVRMDAITSILRKGKLSIAEIADSFNLPVSRVEEIARSMKY